MKLYRWVFAAMQYRVIETTEIDSGRVTERTVATCDSQLEAVGMVMLLRAKRHAQPSKEDKR